MKIIASIPGQPYQNPTYIAEVTADEIANLSLLTSTYGEISVHDHHGGVQSRKFDGFQAGDVIDPKAAIERREALAAYVNSRQEIEKAMSSLRGAMTKLQNLTTPSEIPS